MTTRWLWLSVENTDCHSLTFCSAQRWTGFSQYSRLLSWSYCITCFFFFTSLLHCPHVNLWSVNDWATPHIVAHKLHRFNGKFPNTWLRGKNSSCSTTWFCCSLFFGFQLVSGVFAVFTPQTLRGSVTLLVWGKYVWTAYLRVQKKTNPNCLSSIVYLPTLATLIWCDLITVN